MIVPDIKKFVLLTLLVCATCTLQAQKQLVLLKREKVIMRFNPGDAIVISLKGKKQRIDSYINNLFDTAVALHNTVVPLHKIDRVYFSHTGLVNLIGKFLVVAGVAYFVIDQFNVIVVNGDEPSLNEDVTAASVAMVAVGLPMMLIKKKSQKLTGKYRLITVSEGSPFYLEPINKDTPDP
jgi:hypothetical protein